MNSTSCAPFASMRNNRYSILFGPPCDQPKAIIAEEMIPWPNEPGPPLSGISRVMLAQNNRYIHSPGDPLPLD